jgi:hypothetical protein
LKKRAVRSRPAAKPAAAHVVYTTPLVKNAHDLDRQLVDLQRVPKRDAEP